MSLAPTAQQAAFIDALLTTSAHVALVARAGCGKTSSIVMAVNAYAKANPGHQVLVCAFGNAIAAEVKQKLTAAGHRWPDVDASTTHSMGWSLVRFRYKLDNKAINANKVRDIIRARAEANKGLGERNVDFVYGQQIAKLVQLAKGEAFGFFTPVQNKSAWYDLADKHDVGAFDGAEHMGDIINAAIAVYETSMADTSTVDFGDMILFPLVKNIFVKFTKDLILLDEAQDTSKARQALVRKHLKPTGRMVIVGDDRQAIMGFSGADNDALPGMIADLKATVLPLSVTWRCPKAVVALAQSIVPDLEAAASAPEGEVLYGEKLPDDLKAGDAVLCRNTAPLVEQAYKLIRAGTAAMVEGRDIGAGLKALSRRWKVSTTEGLRTKLVNYRAKEVQKAMAKGDDAKAEAVADRVDTLLQIVAQCELEKKHSIEDVCAFIDRLFGDSVDKDGRPLPSNAVTFATYHKSKGREWERVVLFEHRARCPSKAAKQAWQLRQEENLAYVAITRSKHTLVFAG